jgi:hypothetical protein
MRFSPTASFEAVDFRRARKTVESLTPIFRGDGALVGAVVAAAEFNYGRPIANNDRQNVTAALLAQSFHPRCSEVTTLARNRRPRRRSIISPA